MWVFEDEGYEPKKVIMACQRAGVAVAAQPSQPQTRREQFSVTPPALYLPLSEIHQISYVTTSIDRATREFAERYGVSKFRISRFISSLPGMPEMVMDQAHAFVGPLQI